MNAKTRRERIVKRLEQSLEPISATALANELAVSRQVIVGDIALLRAAGEPIAATGEHSFGEWVTNEDLSSRDCTVCGHRETNYFCPGPGPAEKDHTLIIVVAAAIVIAGSIIAFVVIKKRKTK